MLAPIVQKFIRTAENIAVFFGSEEGERLASAERFKHAVEKPEVGVVEHLREDYAGNNAGDNHGQIIQHSENVHAADFLVYDNRQKVRKKEIERAERSTRAAKG